MKRLGRVVAVTSRGTTVELEPGAACARCARGRGCGAALFTPSGPRLRVDCALAPAASAGCAPEPVVGDAVEVELAGEDARWLLPVVLAYGLPTLGLIAGACAPEPWTPFAAVAGLGGGLLAGRAGGARVALAGSVAGPCRPVARIAQSHESRISPGESA